MPSMLRSPALLPLGLTFAMVACDASSPSPKTDAEAEPKAEAKAEPKAEPKTDAEAEPKTDAEAEPKTDAKAAPKAEVKADPAGSDATPGSERAAPNSDDPRDPANLPADTKAEHKTAFLEIPVGKGDKPPVGGVGPNGIHLSEFMVGRGWTKSRCDEAASSFSIGTDDRANVCMRVVHTAGDESQLTIKWTKEGRPPKRTKMTVKPIRAYLTRAYLPLKSYTKGAWTATVEASDGTVLAEGKFTVEGP